jgi:hypothetical protein
MPQQWFHSNDNGRTWQPFEPKPGSWLVSMNVVENETFDDGYGNLYYWSTSHGDPVPGTPA